MNPFTFAVLAAASLFIAQRSHAADLPVKYDHVDYKQTGNTFTWKPLNGATPGGDGVTFRGPTGIDTVQPKLNTLQRLPYDKRGIVPPSQMAKVASAFTMANAGKAMMLAGKLAWPVAVIMNAGEIVDFLKGLGYKNIKNTGSGITAQMGDADSYEADGFEYRYSDVTPWAFSAKKACDDLAALYSTSYAYNKPMVNIGFDHPIAKNNCVLRFPNGDSTLVGLKQRRVSSCPAGSFVSGMECLPEEPLQNVTQQQIEDKIAQVSGWPSSAARATAAALNTPGVTIQTEPPVVTGPSSVPGSTTTTTTNTQVAPGTTTVVSPGTPGAQPATQTTTSTATTNNTYNNNTVTTTTTTSSTVNITNNITNQTTKDTPDEKKEEEKKEDDKEDETPTDKVLGDIPELYERKYPDGLSGIWTTKSAEIKQTPLFTLPTLLMPTGLTVGTCPAWKVDLSFGGAWGDYGLQDVSPPCWIWDIAKVIIIASALILARALVFGG